MNEEYTGQDVNPKITTANFPGLDHRSLENLGNSAQVQCEDMLSLQESQNDGIVNSQSIPLNGEVLAPPRSVGTEPLTHVVDI